MSGGKGTQLLNERAELSRELTSLRLAVTQLGSDLTRLKCDIAAHGKCGVLKSLQCRKMVCACVCSWCEGCG